MSIRFASLLLLGLSLAAPSSAATSAASEPNFFQDKLYPVMQKAQCRFCHNDNGVASGTRLQFPPEDAAAAEIAQFGLRLRVLVDSVHPEKSLLWLKPTNRIQHSGGERIHPGSAEEQNLHDWVWYLASLRDEHLTETRALHGQGPAILRRLTHSQYNHTVQDLLGDQTRPANQFPPEDYSYGFTNQAESQTISPLLAEAYNRAAEKLSRNAFRGGDTRHLIPCTASSPDDSACRTRFIRDFGRRAFRRPLTEKEAQIYGALFTGEAHAKGDFVAGAQVVVEAMLQSPHFIFHLESGLYRIASRLSYFLIDTMPDRELFRAAEAGELNSSAAVEKQARRLLQDPRAQDSFDQFLAEWLRFDRLRSAIRDRRLFPEYSAELVNNMMEEVRRLFHHLVWEDRSFLDFYTADYAYLNGELARLYGLPAPERDFTEVKFPADTERAGILGSGLFLTLTSKPSDTSPTERGLFVREHLLCQMVPPPPPGVSTTLPLLTDENPLTNRERLKVHLSSPVCSGCHNLVDPVGFGFERYDPIGKFRAKQIVTIFPTLDQMKTKVKTKPTTHELDIDVSASVRGIPNSDFSSPKQLGAILAANAGCQKCVVKQLFRYALGRQETPADQDVIEAALNSFRGSQFRFKSLILSLVTSKPFLGGASE